MFIAHLPSGYLMAVSLLERIPHLRKISSSVIAAGMVGAIAPDFDLIYYYLIDHQQTLHHKFFSHWPLFWLIMLAVAALWYRLTNSSNTSNLFTIFTLGGCLHLTLDSFVGDIYWFAPFEVKSYAMFTVPALYNPWWLSFVLHWSFAVELLICLLAAVLYLRRSNTRLQPVCLQHQHVEGGH